MRGRLLVLALIGLAACTSATDDDLDTSTDELTGFSAKAVTTTLAYGAHTELLSVAPKTVTAVKFTGVAGDEVEAWVKHWGNGTAVLIGPDGRKKLAGADPTANYARDSRVRFTLTRSGTHYVAFRGGSDGTDSVVIHLEKRGGVLPPSSPATSADPCIAHPWPMMGQCRDAAYRSNVEGPLTAALAWSTPFGFTGWDTLEGIAVGRNGTTHLLHGPRSIVMGSEALVYSAVDAAGRRVLSERLDLGDLDRPSLALAADGTPYVLNAFAVARGPQKGLYDRELFRIDTHGVATSVGNLRQPGQALRDGWDENSTRRILPLLRMDAQGRPYVRTYVQNNGASPYLGNTVRFDPTTSRTDLVQPADSSEVPGTDTHLVVPSGGLIDLSSSYVTRTDAAGKYMWMISATGGIIAADFAHDHLFVRSQSDDHRYESPRWHQWNVYSVATGKLLWKTTSHGWLLRVPLFHPNGDAVFHAGKSSFDGSFEIWSADGVQKAAVPMGATNWFPDFALDGAGNTYAVVGKHLVAVDATGATRIDLTMPEEGKRIALGPDHTILVASGTRLMAFR